MEREAPGPESSAPRGLESEVLLRSILAGMLEGVVVHDAAGHIVSCNPSAERILGLTRDQLAGRTSVDPRWRSVHEDGTPFPGEEHPTMQALRSGRAVFDVLMGIEKPDRARRWISINAVPLFAADERAPYAVVATFADVTERRLLEAQLAHSQKMQALGTLAGGVAHELNNVLAVVLSFAALLEADAALGSRAHHDVEEIIAATYRGRDLVRNLLDFARRGEFHLEAIEVNTVVAKTAELLRRTAPRRVTLELAVDPAAGVVRADPTQLTHALLNLCHNAFDAIEGQGKVLLSSQRLTLDEPRVLGDVRLAAGEYVTLSVKDDGTGMDETTSRRLFEPFFTTKPTGKGTGLGLSMVYRVARSHGGAVAVETAPEKGTCMTIYLPHVGRELEAKEGEAKAAGKAPPSCGAPPAGEAQPIEPGHAQAPEAATRTVAPTAAAEGRTTVLLVDDDEKVRLAVGRLLEALGHGVLSAESGERAVALLREHPGAVDLVILDLAMPELDGRQTYQALRAVDPDVRVLLATGMIDDEEVHALEALGVAGVLRKPFDLKELRARLGALPRPRVGSHEP